MLLRHVYSPNNEAPVSNDGKIPGFRKFPFLSSVIKFDNKWANSKQRSQSPNSWGWPLFLQNQKFTLQDEVIYHQVIPSFWKYFFFLFFILEIAATLLFIGVTIFCWFWGSFCWNSSTLPTDLFIFVNPSCLHSNTKNILPYHISTLSSKIQYTTWYYNSQRQKISQNPFPAKHLLKQTTYLLLEAKTSSYFIACTQSCQITMYPRKVKPFPEEPSPWIMMHKIVDKLSFK